jgi:hypothetical protein
MLNALFADVLALVDTGFGWENARLTAVTSIFQALISVFDIRHSFGIRVSEFGFTLHASRRREVIIAYKIPCFV